MRAPPRAGIGQPRLRRTRGRRSGPDVRPAGDESGGGVLLGVSRPRSLVRPDKSRTEKKKRTARADSICRSQHSVRDLHASLGPVLGIRPGRNRGKVRAGALGAHEYTPRVALRASDLPTTPTPGIGGDSGHVGGHDPRSMSWSARG